MMEQFPEPRELKKNLFRWPRQLVVSGVNLLWQRYLRCSLVGLRNPLRVSFNHCGAVAV